MSLLHIDRLSVRYGDTAALKEVSLSVGPGEIVAVVGESGSGKSTLATAAVALLPPSAMMAGAVRIDGADMMRLDERRLESVRGARVGMIFQEPETALNPALTVRRQIGEVLARHTARGRREIAAGVQALLARVGLDVPPGRYPHMLSGGQRQRVAIAMAIAAAPALLIADEPTAALDTMARREIMELLVGLVRERNMGLLLVTHDLTLVGSIADRLAVLDGGRLVEEGAARAMLDRPASSALSAMVAALRRPVRRPSLREREQLVEVRDVARSYPATPRLFERRRTTALERIGFELARGETLAVIGESGSGKSTLARLVLGLDRPDAGRIDLSGRSWAEARGRERRAMRRQVQAVFQDPAASLDPRWSIDRIVAEPLHLLDASPSCVERDRQVADALDIVGLSDMARRLPAQLSGGQRQRVALARALILRPELIVLDEALSALDARLQAEMIDLLLRLQQELGMAYLFIAHDPALVRGLADRVLVLQAGRVVEEGAVADVLERPRNPYTKALVETA